MATLSDDHKIFIVRKLACYYTPTQVVRLVKEELGVDVTRQQVQTYDPSTRSGRALSKKLRVLFDDIRDRYRHEMSECPGYNSAFRMNELFKLYQRAIERGNDAVAKDLLFHMLKEEELLKRWKSDDKPDLLLAFLERIKGTSIPIYTETIEADCTSTVEAENKPHIIYQNYTRIIPRLYERD